LARGWSERHYFHSKRRLLLVHSRNSRSGKQQLKSLFHVSMCVSSITYSYTYDLLVCSHVYTVRQRFTTAASNAWLRQRRCVREKVITVPQLSNCVKSSTHFGLRRVKYGRWIVSTDGTTCIVAAAIFKLPSRSHRLGFKKGVSLSEHGSFLINIHI